MNEFKYALLKAMNKRNCGFREVSMLTGVRLKTLYTYTTGRTLPRPEVARKLSSVMEDDAIWNAFIQEAVSNQIGDLPLSSVLRKERLKRAMTTTALAEKVGVNYTAISRIENGGSTCANTLTNYADYFGIPFERLEELFIRQFGYAPKYYAWDKGKGVNLNGQ